MTDKVSLNDSMLAFFRRFISEADGGADINTVLQPTDITVDATADGVELAAANTDRTMIIVQNVGAYNARIRFSGNPTTIRGLQLAPGQMIGWTAPDCPRTQLKAIREGGNSTTVSVMEV